MKYAIIGPRKGVRRILEDIELTTLPGLSASIVELTDEQAQTVLEGLSATPRTRYFFENNNLITREEKMELEQDKKTIK